MLRISTIVATASRKITEKPANPGVTLSGFGSVVTVVLSRE
jgi:hypothetical protein